MLEISHQQAQYLIRQASDRRLPEQQWNALQAHLEQCPTCRAYRDRLSLLEREVRRSLQDRWHPVSGPAFGLSGAVIRSRLARRERARKIPTYAGLSLLLVVVLVFGLRSLQQAPAPSAALTQAAAALPSLTPTPAERFRGVVAFTSSQVGNSEIYLLTASGVGEPDITNLTQDPSDDTHPTWSADGGWLAFLSNRTGKNEVYLISVAGSRLTQLTSDPDVDWQGPLAWSPDGRWLALVGKRKPLGGQPWIYLLPLNNADPRSSAPRVLPGTQGVSGPLRFYHGLAAAANSPAATSFKGLEQLSLVYVSPQYGGTLVRYDLQAGAATPLTLEDSRSVGINTGVNGGFDIQRAGNLEENIYLAEGRPGSGWEGVHIRRMMLDLLTGQKNYDYITTGTAEGSFRDLLIIPTDRRIAYLQDTDGAGCWRLTLRTDMPGDTIRRLFDQFCVEGQLDSAQWQSGARWAVLLARAPGDPSPALYALRMPPRGDIKGPVIIERLGAAEKPGDQVSVRPEGPALNLQPRAASLMDSPLPQATLSPDLPGTLLLAGPEAVPDQTNQASGSMYSAILLANPAGKLKDDYRVLVPADALNRCPVASPDGAWVAFVSDRASRAANGNKVTLDPKTGAALPLAENLFVVGRDGNNLLQLSQPYAPDNTSPPPAYDCPIWSPDGKYIASVLRTSHGRGLTVNTLQGDLIRYVPVGQTSPLASLAWTPDGQSILVAEPSASSRSPSIVAFNWRAPAAGTTLFTLSGWDDVQGLSVSPDGHQLAMIVVRKGTPSRAAQAGLRVYDLNPFQLAYQRDLPAYDPAVLTNPGRIFWMQDGGLAFAIPSSPLSRYKAMLVRYMPQDDVTQFLAYIDDTLNDWALNGAWLVYSSESGLWGLPVNGRFDQRSVPTRLSAQAPESISWR